MTRPGDTLDQPPFPPLEWIDCDWWEGTAVFPAWAGFQSRGNATESLDDEAPSDGSARVTVTPWDSLESPRPSEAQARAFRFQVERGDEVLAAVLAALRPHYDQMRPSWREAYDEEELDEVMPADPGGFRHLIGLSQVHVHPYLRDGMAYVGLEFGCAWDEEHGLGVMMHGARVVDIGGADVSFAWQPDEAEAL